MPGVLEQKNWLKYMHLRANNEACTQIWMAEKNASGWYMPWKSRIDTGNQKGGQEKTKKEGDGVIPLFASSAAGKSQRMLLKVDKSSDRGAWEVIENCKGDIIDSV